MWHGLSDDELAQAPLPSSMASWAPIRIEPILGGGELITIAVVAVLNGQMHFQQTLGDKSMRCFLGDKANAVTKIAGIAKASVCTYFAENKTISGWSPPLIGVSLGAQELTLANDLTDAVRQAIMDSAFLCALPDRLEAEDSLGDEADDVDTRWPAQVRREVLLIRPDLGSYFGNSFQLSGTAKRTVVDFLSPRYAAMFGRLVPGQRLGGTLNHCKAKLWDLEALIEHEQGSRDAPQLFSQRLHHAELVLWMPSHRDPSYTSNQVRRARESLEELRAAAGKHEIPVVPVHSAQEAASIVLGKAA